MQLFVRSLFLQKCESENIFHAKIPNRNSQLMFVYCKNNIQRCYSHVLGQSENDGWA